MRFRFYPLRFEFLAAESLFFPAGKAANTLRGALGAAFRKIACAPDCEGAKTCALHQTCAYARIFEPAASGGPSGLADLPRPFVFRARHLNGAVIHAGEPFCFNLNVFSLDPGVLEYFVRAAGWLGRDGAGPGRGTARLRRVLSGNQVIWHDGARSVATSVEPESLSLAPSAVYPRSIRVEFLTPTELKHEDRIAQTPDFPILFGRIRDRIATLSRLYGEGALDIDFEATNARAAAVRMTACNVRREEVTRRSSKTGQAHSIGGFTGHAKYEGNLAEFMPFLEAASWTGVGRQSVWGKGEIKIEILE